MSAGSGAEPSVEGAVGPFRGKKILVLEDEPIIAIDLELELEDAGATILRAETVREAEAALDGLDAAILDYSLMSHKNAEPVAEALDARGVPYVFYSGDLDRHGEAISRFGRPTVAKPAAAADVLDALARVLEV